MKTNLLVLAALTFSSIMAQASECGIKSAKDIYKTPYYSVQVEGVEHKGFYKAEDAKTELDALIEVGTCERKAATAKCEIKPAKNIYNRSYYSVHLDGVEHNGFWELQDAKAEVRKMVLNNVCVNSAATSGVIGDLLTGTLSEEDATSLGKKAADSLLDWFNK